jgi:hypothetical protein
VPLRAAPIAAALAVACLLSPSAASASVVSGDGASFALTAAPLEANRVELSVAGGTTLVFRDRGAPLTPGPGCATASTGLIACRLAASGRVDRLTIDLGDGADTATIRSLWTDVTLIGGDGDDVLRFSRGGDEKERNGAVALGGEGNDRIEEADTADGGPGDDSILGSAFAYTEETLHGGPGNDSIDGGGSIDEIHGGPGDDALVDGGGAGEARIFGDEGGDTIGAAGERAAIAGGDGEDRIVSGARVADGGPGDDVLQGGPLLRGAEGDDTLTAADEMNLTWLGLRGNTLEGGPGDDTLTGGRIDDLLDGGEGADVHAGGEGSDTLSYRSRGEPVTIDLRTAERTVAGEGDSAAGDVERIEGTAGDDRIVAGAGPIAVDGFLGEDVIVGGPGPDQLVGGGDSDVIVGGEGDDVIDGGVDSHRERGAAESTRVVGDDFIDAGPGHDVITGRRGDDYVIGGSGNDSFDLRDSSGVNHSHIIQFSGADQALCGDGEDTVDADYADDVALDCEVVAEGTPRWRPTKVRPGRSLRLTVRCAWTESRPCKGTARLRTATGRAGPGGTEPTSAAAPARCLTTPGATIARQSFRIRAGRVNYVSLTLDRAADRRLTKRGCIAAHAVFEFTDGRRRPWVATRSLALKRPGVELR